MIYTLLPGESILRETGDLSIIITITDHPVYIITI